MPQAIVPQTTTPALRARGAVSSPLAVGAPGRLPSPTLAGRGGPSLANRPAPAKRRICSPQYWGAGGAASSPGPAGLGHLVPSAPSNASNVGAMSGIGG